MPETTVLQASHAQAAQHDAKHEAAHIGGFCFEVIGLGFGDGVGENEFGGFC